MMRGNDSQSVERYVATANLAAVLAAQGRKQTWLAKRLGVSSSLLCLIIGGAKTVDRTRGRQVAEVLGVPFGLLFKLRSRRNLDADARTRLPSAATASDPGNTRLVVRQGDRQRLLRPASGKQVGQPEAGGRAPPA